MTEFKRLSKTDISNLINGLMKHLYSLINIEKLSDKTFSARIAAISMNTLKGFSN